LDKLVCDSRYQRGIEEKRVTRIIDNFDAKLLGTLELSKRKNGTFAVIDGQHRFEALKALGRKTCPALVHSDLSVQQEADLFARQNMGRKQLTPVQRFRAQASSSPTCSRHRRQSHCRPASLGRHAMKASASGG
jgi:hypothetical protein